MMRALERAGIIIEPGLDSIIETPLGAEYLCVAPALCLKTLTSGQVHDRRYRTASDSER